MADICGWCGGPIPRTARRDSKYCGTPHRQAAHRAKVARAEAARTREPLSLAYADPPYPGKARLYRDHPDYGGEVDHRELLEELSTFDGWALSTSAQALPGLCFVALSRGIPVRVAAWTTGRPVPHPNARVVSGWEPVMYWPARTSRAASSKPTADALIGVTTRQRPTLPGAVIGMKSPEFCVWVFGLLGAEPGDLFHDLFPGSGIVDRSWRAWSGADEPPELGLVL